MVKVKPDDPILCLTFNRYVYFLFRGNRAIFAWHIANSRFDFEVPFQGYNVTLKIQGQRSRSNVPYSAQHLVDLFHICFTPTGPTIPMIWQIECSTGGKLVWKFSKKIVKNISDSNPPKVFQGESMTNEIYTLTFVALWWTVLTI